MVHSKYLDSLTKEQRDELIHKLWEMQNHICFICGKEIDLDLQPTDVDHIKPLANGGKDDETNFALTHSSCNRSKKDADLEIARRLAQLDVIINNAEQKRETPSLKHVLLAFGGSKYKLRYKVEEGCFKYSLDDTGDTSIHKAHIFHDELSGEDTVFIQLPLEYIYHDEVINPRGINSTISLLMKEFHKPNPQLQVSLARIDDGFVKVFDGQHKAVAQIMLGVKSILLRVFIHPDVDRLTETNTNAGSKLKQIAFDKSIVRQLHDTLYSEKIKQYQDGHGLSPDDYSFSEQNLIDYFKGQRANIKLYIINSQKNAIAHNPDNRLSSYINFEGRGNDLPLSYSTFEKTILSAFINNKTILQKPINYKMDEGLNERVLEKDQIIRLCNIIAGTILINKFDTSIGTYKLENQIANGNGATIPDEHLIAFRLCKEEVMYNWVKYIELVIKGYFSNTGSQYNEDNLFMQKFPDQLWDNLTNFMINLHDLPLWKDRSLSSTIFGGKNNYDFWGTVFKTGKTPDQTQVLASPINWIEMIKKRP